MSELIDPKREQLLESRGPEAIRMLLLQASGPGEGSAILGLGDFLPGRPTRGDAERWLARKDAEKQADQARRDAQMLRWAKIGGIAAIVAAILGAIAVSVTVAAWRWPTS